ncbi:MAG: dynamin family protein [Treponema sp.]|jgi:GTPase Era involved in 16S rRNA processing|nr:dynamin family protein [Treponema sp.]
MEYTIMDEKQMKRLECLKQTVDEALDTLDKAYNVNKNTVDFYDNLTSCLRTMREDLIKFKARVKGERKPTVGVFGCPSRGKSTLLNVLLGVNILTMRSTDGTTRFGTELSYKNTEQFQVTVKYNNKAPEIRNDIPEDKVGSTLTEYSDESKPGNLDISKIEVQGPFHSFLGNDMVFLDTPGVELGASKEDKNSPVNHDFEADTNRALTILSSVDVVIFCMIHKLKERKDAVFYQKKIKGQYDPINVITAADARDEGETNNDIKKKVQKDYGLLTHRTVVVSSKEALKKIKTARSEGREISQMIAAEFKGENLEEFMNLSNMILKEIAKTTGNIENRIRHFEELYENLRREAKEKNFDIGALKSTPSINKTIIDMINKGLDKDEQITRDFLRKIPPVQRTYVGLVKYIRKHVPGE